MSTSNEGDAAPAAKTRTKGRRWEKRSPGFVVSQRTCGLLGLLRLSQDLGHKMFLSLGALCES